MQAQRANRFDFFFQFFSHQQELPSRIIAKVPNRKQDLKFSGRFPSSCMLFKITKNGKSLLKSFISMVTLR